MINNNLIADHIQQTDAGRQPRPCDSLCSDSSILSATAALFPAESRTRMLRTPKRSSYAPKRQSPRLRLRSVLLRLQRVAGQQSLLLRLQRLPILRLSPPPRAMTAALLPSSDSSILSATAALLPAESRTRMLRNRVRIRGLRRMKKAGQ